MQQSFTLAEAIQKLESYCGYQERCHEEVMQKLKSLNMIPEAIDHVIVHLLSQNFLNEERFARSFARGKHQIKGWGKIRIVNELRQRKISQFNITLALREIDEDDYLTSFDLLARKIWENLHERHVLKKRKKCCDFLLRKGYESNLVYEKIKDLERKNS